MITIKSYTDIEQSCKLEKILPLESADQTWVRIVIAGANLNVPEEIQYRHNGDIPFHIFSGIGIPCWSLAALFGVLPFIDFTTPQLIGTPKTLYRCMYNDDLKSHAYDNPVDACYEMILKLHKLNLL